MPSPNRIPKHDDSNRDIRDFISPPPSQRRRRRIIESSSSDEQNQELQAGHPADVQPQLPLPGAPNNENEQPNPIHISSGDSESSDSMYVANVATPQPAQVLQNRNGRPASQRQRRQATPTQRRPSPLPQQRATNRRPVTPQRPLNDVIRQRRYDAEAESTSEEETSGLSADESDPNAADLYRAAMLSVRNRPNAVQQVSTATQDETTSYFHSSGLTRFLAQFALNSWNSFATFEIIEFQTRGIMHMHMPLQQLKKYVQYISAYMAK